MNVLYVDHTSLVSGAQRALLDLLRGLPASVVPTVMCPQGRLADLVTELGVRVVDYPGTSGSLRLHPRHTTVAVGEMALSALAVRRAADALGADIVHANSIRAGLIAGAVRRLGGPPTIAHIHDALPDSRSARLVRRAISSSVDALLMISRYTSDSFEPGGPRPGLHILHNPLDLTSFDPTTMTKASARRALGLEQDAQLVGLVAQITPWKGQDTAIRALDLVHRRHPDARLLLVGEPKFVDQAARYDNVSYSRWLYRLVRGLGLEERVEFWGEREDVPTIVRALDVALAPSWEEPFGRSVIEAMALRTAVIATSVGGPAEYITHGVDGLLLAPRDVARWGVGLERLLRDGELREAMGARGSVTVRERFDRQVYVSKILQVYEEIVSGPGRTRGRIQGLDGRGDLRQAVRP